MPLLTAVAARLAVGERSSGTASRGLAWALALSAALLVSRLDLAAHVAFGDAEALYLAYGLHPQPAYLDHPGLIGWIARELGPHREPHAIHVVTALVATALPWLGVLAARACGADGPRSWRSFFALALVPELSIGAFAFAPELVSGVCWLLALSCMGWALRRPARSFDALLASLGAGFFTAWACLAKTSGFALAAALFATWLVGPGRERLRTLAPWAALLTFALLASPLLAWWVLHGVSVQLDLPDGVGSLALRLSRAPLHVTPPFLIAGVVLLRHLLSKRPRDDVDRLLIWLTWLPLVPLSLLAAFSNSGNDWLTPALIALSIHAARAPALPRRLAHSCLWLGAGITALGWGWMRTDLPLWVGDWLGGYDPNRDASNDHFTWGPGRELIREAVSESLEQTGVPPLVVGPHWAICAQADTALAGRIPVGCDDVRATDYDAWSERARWSRAEVLLFVTDSRFHESPPEQLYGRSPLASRRAKVQRFGRTVRTVSVTTFEAPDAVALGSGWEPRPPSP